MDSKQSVTPPRTNNAVEATHGYIDRGWSVVPVPRGEKGPNLPEWQKLRIKSEQVGEFFTEGSNIGIVLGEASGGIADVDLDCLEAEHAGSELLPQTRTSGRGNKTRHHWYVSPGSKSHKFKDTDGDVLVEVRGDGGYQTLVYPSEHPSGDFYEWKRDVEPLELEAHELRSAAARVAVSALIARHLPESGRHDVALAYAGLMLRPLIDLGETKEDATEYVWQVLRPAWECKSANEKSLSDLYAIIEDTADKIEVDEPATGGPSLSEHLEHGQAIVKRIKDWLGWGELTAEQREAIEQRQREKRADRAWADERVRELAHDPDILARVYKIMRDGGLVGETRNAKLLPLTAVTMHLGRPQSLLLNDNSSTGKSYLLKQLIKTLPEWMVYVVQSVSQQGLAYLGETTLKGRFFIPYELGGLGNKESDSLEQIKGLITEGSIIRDSVKDHAGHKLRVEGPTGVLTTTTKQFMDHELSTRMFRIHMTNTPEHRRNILKARIKRNTSAADYGPIQGLHTYLAGQENRVVVPFEDELTDRVDVSSERIIRDHERLMDLIEAHAVLHQATRDKDGQGRIVATIDDYAAVHALIADVLGEASEVAVSDTVRETVGIVRELIDEDKEVTRNTVAEKLGINPTSAGRRFTPATAAGFVKEDPDNPNQKPKRYVLGNVPLPENVEVIPSPETLTSCVRASASGGGSGSNESEKHDARTDARSDARMHARSRGSVVVEVEKSFTNGDCGEHHGDTDTDCGLSQNGTHGRTIFGDGAPVPENGRTVHASVRNIVRPERVDGDQLRALVRDFLDRYPMSSYATLWRVAGLDHDRADWETFVSLVIEEREAAA